ncbi:hypothetical protein NW757_004384 [Fusarium falciforme]|nr:hypothetical protein NW757_004384 [Fusarium falciforme]
MLSSRTTPKVSFDVAIELSPARFDKVTPLSAEDYQVAGWNIAQRFPAQELKPDDPEVPCVLVGPSFDFADVAAGLPKVKAAIDELQPGTSLEKESDRVEVRVGVQGGISGGETILFAKKITTLVMVLEKHLLCKLRSPYLKDDDNLMSKESKVAVGPWPQGNVVSSDYDSHIPPMATMKPAVWNNQEPECMYRKFSLIWAAPSLRELSYMCAPHWKVCDFYIGPPTELPLSRIPWGIEESPQDPSPWWEFGKEFDLFRERSNRQWDSEERHTYFYFTYLQSTFEHKLLRNWVEVIARIAELALASSDEYKRCLETIFTILHESGSGFTAWAPLMKRVLNLEHRIPDWRDQIPWYLR